ncbi:ExeM/NucH family extracellular endonuclease [Kineococcus sp. DHX-1]|uniref:ExeM/NucH family extracellular endonuclease n=1 Tax=Kineococcus sp. DHX-1 TaxID=3349638 RepID=UPI0036D3C2FA
MIDRKAPAMHRPTTRPSRRRLLTGGALSLLLAGPLTALPAAAATCPAPTRTIGAVQGAGDATPLAGQRVTVAGTVVGDTPGLNGFSVQDRGDRDPRTSDGVFVHAPGAQVDLGDTVAVTGTAGEFGGQTQVSATSAAVTVCRDGSEKDLPRAARLDLPADDAARERLEGMLVAPADRLTVSEVHGLTSYGELTLSEGGLLVQPTELARPGTPAAQRIAARNTERSIVLDDARTARTSTTARPYLDPDTPVRVGDTARLREPVVLGYGFDAWRLQPADGTADGLLAGQDTRRDRPDRVGGDVRVGAFNVLNYFLTFSGPNARGADDQAGLDRQAGKIVPAIQALGADVVTLMEIEDTDSTGLTPGDADTALADLVRRLNASGRAGHWSYVPMPQELYGTDRDVIRNAIVYRDDVVAPVGAPVGLVDETVWDNAREPQAQTFQRTRRPAAADRFTVVANHFKSKGSGDAATGDNADTGDGQGAWNGDRVRQAASLAGFVDALRRSTGDPDVLVLGDLNSYSQEDPVEELRRNGLTDLGSRFDRGRHSYVFDALSGSLDHALATRELTRKVSGAVHWNVNSVESGAYQYDGDPALYAADPFRSSDHDPVVVGLDLRD